MGINDLWKILEPTAQRRSFLELSVREGFEGKRHGTGVIVVGIDASTWVHECEMAFPGHSRSGQNPELRVLFDRISWLSRSAVSAVFIFDGPYRPKRQHDRLVRNTFPGWMKIAFQELVLGFGFHCYTALGSAEAELAYLNKHQAIDAVLTCDTDAFLYGATQVIRSPRDSRHLDDVDVFTANAFSCQPNGEFSAVDAPAITVFAFAIAIFNGSDYNVAGLPGCGKVTAKALASGPLATSLFNAGNYLSGDALRVFLDEWRIQLRDELANDPYKRLGRKLPSLAARLPNTFPNPDIVQCYCHPLTSQGSSLMKDSPAWLIPTLPNTSKLAALCNRLFSWGPDIVSRFTSIVWDGYFIRYLVKRSMTATNTSVPDIRYITKARVKLESPSGPNFLSYQTVFWVPTLVAEVVSTISECSRSGTQIQGAGSTITMSDWVPGPIVWAAARSQVVDFHEESLGDDTPSEPNNYIPVLEADLNVRASSSML